MRRRFGGVFLVAALLGCKGQGQPAQAAEAAAETAPEPAPPGTAAEPAPSPPEPLPMGLPDLGSYAYSRGPGRAAFRRASRLARAGDFAEALAAARQAVARDPTHLEAQWLLARALVAAGRFEEAVVPLSAAAAGDWLRFGEISLSAPGFASFHESPAGAGYRQLAEHYRGRFREAIGGGLLVVGRRGKPWYPALEGPTSVNHRSEIYAHDLATGRALRVSRSDGTLVGFVRAPAGHLLAFASYRKVAGAEGEGSEAAGEEPPVILRELEVGLVDLAEARMSRRRITLTDVRRVELFFDQGGALHARALPARSEEKLLRLDPEQARAWPVPEAEPAGPVLRVSYGVAETLKPAVAGIAADWDGAGSAGAFRLDATRRTITVPDGASASRDSFRWSPDRTRLAFTTVPADRCAPDPQARATTLYLVEAATGVLRAVAAGEGPFAPSWVDEGRMAYVDRGGAAPVVRLLDAVTGEELATLESEGGVGTETLPPAGMCQLLPPGGGAAADANEEES